MCLTCYLDSDSDQQQVPEEDEDKPIDVFPHNIF